METAVSLFACLLVLISILPFVPHSHWVFRVPEFLQLQLIPLQLISITLLVVCCPLHTWNLLLLVVQTGLLLYHAYHLIRYTKFWKTNRTTPSSHASVTVKVIACNVYQFNQEYERFIALIRRENPQVFVTMESNADWEHHLDELQTAYPHAIKVALENTYGMHVYSQLPFKRHQVHYFVADDIPSIECEMQTPDEQPFVFFVVHPPPPSPTEEENAKERDGELLSIAKRIRSLQHPVIVTGDFNNVAWAKSSKLFKKTSELIDARVGRGLISTFHAKYWFFRVPLDLLFHSTTVFVTDLKRYKNIGSDHFPVGFSFYIDHASPQPTEPVEQLEEGEMREVNAIIAEGQQEESDNREEVATE